MKTINSNVKGSWLDLYKVAKDRLENVPNVNGIISAFNSNIDAVIKIKGQFIEELISKLGMNKDSVLTPGASAINTPEDVIRGFVHCFKGGIAEEWIVEKEEAYHWMEKNIGYDKLQMGGQGGIIANTAAICGINPVYVHCASLPKMQADLFLDLDNLISFDQNGNPAKAASINRNDLPLIHWILEFDKGDTITIDGEVITCPKANRFIATYDPLNLELHICESFNKGILNSKAALDFILLAGYHLVKEQLPSGKSGLQRIDESMEIINKWKEKNPDACVHFEFASTQDLAVRKHMVETIAKQVDSIGCNERELIDILEVLGEDELAKECDANTNSVNLFKGLVKIFNYTKAPRIQLHMFGLYVTITRKDACLSAEDNREGMIMAATIAAAKAGTGSIYEKENLLWAYGKEVSDVSVNEITALAEYLNETNGQNELLNTGIAKFSEYDVIATPTIIIEKPITLVGMGDTISSLSLIGAKARK